MSHPARRQGDRQPIHPAGAPGGRGSVAAADDIDILILGGPRRAVCVTQADIMAMTKETDDHTQRGWGKTSASFGPDGGSRQFRVSPDISRARR